MTINIFVLKGGVNGKIVVVRFFFLSGIPQSQTADKPMPPRGRATQQSRDTRKTN